MPGEVFVNTNILVYAHDLEAGAKHQKAKNLVAEAWHHCPPPWVSIQVLQELLVNLRRKGIAPTDARHTVEDYMQWQVVENTRSLLADGLNEMDRWQLSLWGGMILAAARWAGATIVWSEDLSEDQDYDGIRVVNPIK